MHNRRKAYRRGIWGERVAILFLCLKGYRIIARRNRNPMGEIDLIAQRGQTVAFIEVKTRKNFKHLDEVLTTRQQQRIQRAASLFAAQPRYREAILRFDVMLVAPFRFPKHITHAW